MCGASLASTAGNCVSKLATGEIKLVYGGLPPGKLVYPLSGRSTAKLGLRISSSGFSKLMDLIDLNEVTLARLIFCNIGKDRTGYENAKSSWRVFSALI